MNRTHALALFVFATLPIPAQAAATGYDLNIFLGQRDPVFDAFYGLTVPPPAPPGAATSTGNLYDFRLFLNQRDPVFDAFYSIPAAAPAVPPTTPAAPIRR